MYYFILNKVLPASVREAYQSGKPSCQGRHQRTDADIITWYYRAGLEASIP